MKKVLFGLTLLLLLSCQDYGNIDKRANLSRSLSEISGLASFENSPLFYAIADHGNPNYVFAIDSTGFIAQEIVVANATNEDWEDVATDGKNRLFIGDFGNNENDRKEQAIYTIENFLSYKKDVDTAFAQKTTFTLSDQENYPPDLKDRNYDIEAFIFKDENLFLFTRNRSRNFDGTTKVYKLPAKPGTYEAQLITSYKICGDENNCFVTGATLAPDGKTILLLTFNKIFRLSGYTGDQFFKGKVEALPLNYSSQKEGICFKGNNIVYIVDERRAQKGGNLYTYKIK